MISPVNSSTAATDDADYRDELQSGAAEIPDTEYGDDVLRGAPAISKYRNEPERRTNYLLEKRIIPAYKIGDRWEMRKSTHRKFIADLEEEAIARAKSATEVA
jgi:hypothetical protein